MTNNGALNTLIAELARWRSTTYVNLYRRHPEFRKESAIFEGAVHRARKLGLVVWRRRQTRIELVEGARCPCCNREL